MVKSVAMPVRNFGAMVRIFTIPLAIYALCLAYASRLFIFGFENDQVASMIFLGVLSVLAGVLVLIWGIVGWHRYVLNGGPATWLTPVGYRNFLRYVFDLIVIFIFFALVLLIPIRFTLNLLIATNAQAALATISPFASVLIIWLFLCVSPLLPSSAIDKRIGLEDAWRATSKGRLALLWVGVVWVVVDQLGTRALGSLALTLTTTESIRVFMAAQMVWMAIFGMWGVSLITTIYGYFVEDRAL